MTVKMRVRVKENRLPEIARRLPMQADRVCRHTAFAIERDMKSSMHGGGPSAPGQPPAIDTGALVNSIQTTQVATAHWRITVASEYGAYLEYGTIFMEPRPFVEPAVDDNEQDFYAAMKALERGLA